MQGKAHHRTAGNDAGRIVFQALGTLLDKVAVKCPDADTIITRFVNGVAADSDDTLITGRSSLTARAACIAVATLSTITPTAEGRALSGTTRPVTA